MFITKKSIDRRLFLRGAGISLALPFLDAMVPALSAAPKVASRLGFVYIPMGSNISQWTPKTTGKLTDLSPTLKALAPYLNQLTVFSNLELKNSYSPGNHATSNSGFLSAAKAKMTEGSDYHLGTTVDQIAAKMIGSETKLPSLELCMDTLAPVGSCDNGYACVYQNNLSWSSPTTPLQAEANPRIVFERLFGDGGSVEDRLKELQKNSSILDWVNQDMNRLKKKLGVEDKNRLDGYISSVREIERRIQLAERSADQSDVRDLTRPIGVPTDYSDHVRLMFDLEVLAFRTDATRIITMQLARETSTRTYPEIGVPEAHHPTSHHTNSPEKLEKLAKINANHISLFAYLLEKLKAIPEGDGNILDNTTFLYGSGMGNSDVHDHVRLPIIVVGGRKTEENHVSFKESTPLANLHLGILDRVGVHLDSFSDSTNRIKV